MDSKKSILILGLLAMVLLISSEVSVEASSNKKEETNGVGGPGSYGGGGNNGGGGPGSYGGGGNNGGGGPGSYGGGPGSYGGGGNNGGGYHAPPK